MAKDSQRFFNNILIVGILSIIIVIGIFKFAMNEDTHPCSIDRFPGACYEVERTICVKQWEASEQECKKQIESLNLPPTRLTGPIMDRCQKSKYDRVFHYLRKHVKSCEDSVADLDNWRKSNPDF